MNNVPDGYPTPEDGATGLRINIEAKDGVVLVEFSKPVMHMSLTPAQVRPFSIALLQNAEMAQAQPVAEQLPPSRLQ